MVKKTCANCRKLTKVSFFYFLLNKVICENCGIKLKIKNGFKSIIVFHFIVFVLSLIVLYLFPFLTESYRFYLYLIFVFLIGLVFSARYCVLICSVKRE